MKRYGTLFLSKTSRALYEKSEISISKGTVRRILEGKRSLSENIIALLEFFGLSVEDDSFIKEDDILINEAQITSQNNIFRIGNNTTINNAVSDLYEASPEDAQAVELITILRKLIFGGGQSDYDRIQQCGVDHLIKVFYIRTKLVLEQKFGKSRDFVPHLTAHSCCYLGLAEIIYVVNYLCKTVY